ncbi:uncharacterized protein LOC123273773 [Cotesia glomerata]|uniref:Uncharacterized protein n=1 Tax=Cotesia glomerata TaxID=32391 RepID=A0AAV7ILB6_COTGL|nr:uncharacterized protein LOC123273773 [Cotesia glomerata]KAH0553248.1 hypothetical protein KQX54_000966 [Cotesia glomerata]
MLLASFPIRTSSRQDVARDFVQKFKMAAVNRQAMLDGFTCDEEIANWVTNDPTVELKGFVDKIEGTKRVPVSKGSTEMTSLYKVIVSNGSSSKVRVLFWGQMATVYSASIRDRSVIGIERAKTTSGNATFNNPYEHIGPLELTLNNSSVVNVSGDIFDEVVDDAPIEVVRLIDAPNYNKKMYVLAWVKLPFGPVTLYGSTHGSGAIIDGNYRLRVQIANYVANPLLVKGVYVKILCQSSVDTKGNSYLMVRNSDDIVIAPGKPAMTAAELHKSGFVTPKRSSDDDQGGVPKKFAPIG